MNGIAERHDYVYGTDIYDYHTYAIKKWGIFHLDHKDKTIEKEYQN